eukprot:g617.t1
MSQKLSNELHTSGKKLVIHDLQESFEDSQFGNSQLLDGFINPKPSSRRKVRELFQPDGSTIKVELKEKQRSLPFMLLYNTVGQQTYQQIMQMEDEYYLTSCEKKILETKAAEIAAYIPDNASIFDLGCGSMEKTKILVDHLRNSGKTGINVYGVDIDRAYLKTVLTGLIEDQQKTKAPHKAEFEFIGLHATYEQSIPFIKKTPGPCILLCMGGTIGNMSRLKSVAFLRQFQEKAMRPGDCFFLGFDKRKDPRVIARAYQDSKGLFNARTMHGLKTLNKMFCKHAVELNNFDTVVGYDAVDGVNERFYRSLVKQTIKVPPPFSGSDDESVEVQLEKDELISIVNSFKYSQDEVNDLAAAANFTVTDQWSDPRDIYWFCLFKTSLEE